MSHSSGPNTRKSIAAKEPEKVERAKAELLSPSDRAELEATFGKVIGPIIDAKLETKAAELIERSRLAHLKIMHAVLGDQSNRDQLLVSREKAAETLGVSLSTIKRMEGRELPDPIKINDRVVRHRLVDIEAIARTRRPICPD